jgi:hypothetical protein
MLDRTQALRRHSLSFRPTADDMFEQMMGPGSGAGLIDAILAQPDYLRLWLGWLVFVNIVVPLLFWPRTETWVTILAFLAGGAIMSALYETYGYSKILGAAHLIVWPPLLLWLWSRWYGVDSVAMRLWIVILAASNLASLAIDAFDVAGFFLSR